MISATKQSKEILCRRQTRPSYVHGEKGMAYVELAIGVTTFFLLVFGVLEFSRLFWTHNALTDATRRGARYAVVSPGSVANVKNVVVYGTPTPADGASPVVYGLSTSDVQVTYSANFGVKNGTVTVSITNYVFNFSVPLIGTTISLPAYKTTLTGESAGYVPATL